jgi:hypothetical protein
MVERVLTEIVSSIGKLSVSSAPQTRKRVEPA